MRFGHFFLLFFAGMACSCLGQRQLVDSLQRQIKILEKEGVTKKDTNYLKLLNEFAFSYQRISPDSALILSELSRQWSADAGFAKGQSEALRNIGIVYYLRGDYPIALQHFYEALKQAEEIKYLQGIGRLYNNIGLIYYGQSKYEEALQAQVRSMEIKEKMNDKPGLATSLNNIANIYKNQKKYDESLKYHFRALNVRKELGDNRGVAASLNNIAWLYITKQNYTEAFTYFREAQPKNEVAQDKIVGSDIEQGMAECYHAFKKYDLAIASAQRGLQIAKSINLKDQLRDCNETLANVYKSKGEYQSALRHFELFKLYADSINNSEIEQRTALQQMQYEFEKRETVLKSEQAILNSNHEKERIQQRWIVVSILGGLAFAIFIAVIIFRGRRKIEKAYRELEQANHETQAKSEILRVINAELQHQKEEIATQRDIMADQNVKLQQASNIIEEQNLEIRNRIENLENEVERRTKELLDYNQQLEQFAFIAAHNLRAPVATILGLGNILSLGTDDVSEKSLIYDKLISTTKDLDRVVRDLNTILDIRKNSNAVISEINLKDEFDLLLASLEKEIQETQTQIKSDFTSIHRVHAVKPYLDSILYNLISNAIKYRHPERTPHISIHTEKRDAHVCITIEDNGLGIDLRLFKDKVFTLYSRFHTHVEGKGLGLHMVKTQLASMGGSIDLRSEVDKEPPSSFICLGGNNTRRY